MQNYKLFGQTIASDLDLSDLLWSTYNSTTLTVQTFPFSELDYSYELVDIFPTNADLCNQTLIIQKGTELYRFNYKNIASFDLYPKQICIFTCPNLDPQIVKSRLLGPVISLWLELNGHPVLHASAILDRNSEAVLFVGHSGMGKSTLASTMVFAGFEFFSDDLVPVNLNSAKPTALAGPPNMRLRKEQISFYGVNPSDCLDLPSKQTKRAISLKAKYKDENNIQAAAIKRIYIIDTIDRPDPVTSPVSFSPITPNDALLALIQCSFAALVLNQTGLQPGRMKQLARIVETVSCKKIHLKEKTTDYQLIADHLIEDLDSYSQ